MSVRLFFRRSYVPRPPNLLRGPARAGEDQVRMRRRRDVGKGSSKGKWGQILIDSRMEAKLGGWSRRPMPKMLKVI